ncbi:MAG: hypothetical protein ACYDAQ_10625 [Mycobacteriales bacterium]
MPGGQETIYIPGAGVAPAEDEHAPGSGSGDLTDELINTNVWSEAMLARAGIPIVDSPFVSVGGGIGSFVMVDHLRVAGVPTASIKVLGINDTPWQTYEYLATNSQIPRRERLRSDAASCPDNVWGFPSYAVREAWHAKGLSAKLAPLWNVLTEPVLCDYFTPKSGQVFESLQREADRIGYWSCLVKGLVRMTRHREGGGFFTILTPPAGQSATKRVAYRSAYVHVAVGYPGLRFLPDLQDYRQRHADYQHVVNAYEPHEHVYDELLRHPGTVVVRGNGIVASRILQRIVDDRDHKGAQTKVIHLFRHYVDGTQGDHPWMRRPAKDGWIFQGFNWPKGSWGGQLLGRLAGLEGEERAKLLDVMGGTTTPHRKLWIDQLDRGRKEGFYKVFVGEVHEVVPGRDGKPMTRIKTRDGLLEIAADYIIDGTGLEADIREHRYLADLLDHSGVGRNVKGKLDVGRNFEVRGQGQPSGTMYAVGTATLGAYYAGVDSFLGLQYASLAIVDDLAKRGFCKRITPLRSFHQWLLWARHKTI